MCSAEATDVQTWLEQAERCAFSMEQRSNYAVLMGVQIRLRKEECALGMGQRYRIMQLRFMQRKQEAQRGGLLSHGHGASRNRRIYCISPLCRSACDEVPATLSH
eukprot:scaffold2027_cov148-Skeletonema_marinoi.AAC.1